MHCSQFLGQCFTFSVVWNWHDSCQVNCCCYWFLELLSYLNICSRCAETEQGVAQAIIRSNVDFKREPWPKVSDNAKDLVKKMLDPDPKRRLTAQQVLGMIFLKGRSTMLMNFDAQKVLLLVTIGFLRYKMSETLTWVRLFCLYSRTSLATKCQEGSKCSLGWNCESKAQAIFRDEQAQEKSSKGNALKDEQHIQITTYFLASHSGRLIDVNWAVLILCQMNR